MISWACSIFHRRDWLATTNHYWQGNPQAILSLHYARSSRSNQRSVSNSAQSFCATFPLQLAHVKYQETITACKKREAFSDEHPLYRASIGIPWNTLTFFCQVSVILSAWRKNLTIQPWYQPQQCWDDFDSWGAVIPVNWGDFWQKRCEKNLFFVIDNRFMWFTLPILRSCLSTKPQKTRLLRDRINVE